jgi:hypothetical protein
MGEGDASGKASTAGERKLSKTVENHLADVVRKGPFKGELSRPYTGSPLTIEEIMQSGTPTPDRFIPGALRWDVAGTFRGTEGTWELVLDPKTNTVVHFLFR